MHAGKGFSFLRLFWLGDKATRAVMSHNKSSILQQCASEEAEGRIKAGQASQIHLFNTHSHAAVSFSSGGLMEPAVFHAASLNSSPLKYTVLLDCFALFLRPWI